MRSARAFSVLALVILLPGCVVSPLGVPRPLAEIGHPDSLIVVEDVELPRVTGVAGCGAQALACALNHADKESFPDATVIAAELPWHDRGATPVELILEARRRGCTATVYRGDRWRLRNAIHRGDPVIAMIDAGPVVQTPTDTLTTTRVMHWVVVSGIRTDASVVLLAAVDGRHYALPREVLLQRWHASDNCMIIVSKDG